MKFVFISLFTALLPEKVSVSKVWKSSPQTRLFELEFVFIIIIIIVIIIIIYLFIFWKL